MNEKLERNPAIMVVDLQVDFCPGGSLAVKDGDRIVDDIDKLVDAFDANGLIVVFTRDWHPKNHSSFKEYGGAWPVHAVQGTAGAELHPELHVPLDAIIINKGTDPAKEAYSGFSETGLADLLREKGVNEVFVCGLATDYCVKATAADAVRNGFVTHIVLDCVKGVDVNPGDSARALKELRDLGVLETNGKELLRLVVREGSGSAKRVKV